MEIRFVLNKVAAFIVWMSMGISKQVYHSNSLSKTG